MENQGNHHLNAADGWLKLGLPEEAAKELALVSHVTKRQPEYLSLTWRLYSSQSMWEDALLVANRWTQRYPDNADAWISLATTLERIPTPHGGIPAAWDILRSKVDLFHDDERFKIRLASYAMSMNQPRKANEWLSQAVKTLNKSSLDHLLAEDAELMKLVDELPFE